MALVLHQKLIHEFSTLIIWGFVTEKFHLLYVVSTVIKYVFLLFKYILFCVKDICQIVFNRPGVAGAVLQIASSLIHSFSDPFPPNVVVYTTRLLRLNRCHLCHLRGVYLHGSWNFERMFTPPNMSHVMWHVSRVTCHMSRVTCHVSPVTCLM